MSLYGRSICRSSVRTLKFVSVFKVSDYRITAVPTPEESFWTHCRYYDKLLGDRILSHPISLWISNPHTSGTCEHG